MGAAGLKVRLHWHALVCVYAQHLTYTISRLSFLVRLRKQRAYC